MRSPLRRKQKLTVIGPKQHLTPQEALAYWLKKDATVRARLYRKKGTKWLHVDDLSLIDLTQIIQEMENSLREAYGGGQYQLKLVDVSGHLLGQYEYPIAGPVRYQDDGEDRPSSRRSTKLEEMILEIFKAKFSEDPAASLVAQLTALKALQGDNAFGNEMVSVMANNFITQKENMLDNVSKVLEISKSMVPVTQDDSLMTLLAGGIPVLGQLLMNKNAAGAAQPQQPAQPQLAAVPPPSGAQSAPQVEVEDQPPADRRIAKIREEILAGAEPRDLADRILLLVRTEAFDCAFDLRDQHPALAGMVMEREPTKLAEAYNSFCAAVPELASNPELAHRVGMALAARVMQQVSAESEESEQAEPAEQRESQPLTEDAEKVVESLKPDAAIESEVTYNETDHESGEFENAERIDVPGRDERQDAEEGGPTSEDAGRRD